MRSRKSTYFGIGIVIILGFIVYSLSQNYFKKQNQPPLSPAKALAQTINSNTDWKTYSNNDYFFQIDYPSRFKVIENVKREDFYDTLTTLTSQSKTKESFTFRALHDIDIYNNSKPETVAKREIMDSGLKYHITTIKIGDYFAAITTFDIIAPDIRPTTTITITHPNKNLFIVIDINADLSLVEFEQILSTFKFLDSSNNTTSNTNNYDTAIKILRAIPEIQIIENAVIKNGRTTFFTQGSINGDIVTVWFYEGGFPDQHTTRIDTFNVNIKSNVITVSDVAMK